MISAYYGNDKLVYTPGDKIAEGGAGVVYEIQGIDNKVMKIFKKREKQREKKIKAISQLPWNEDMKRYIVLPQVVLYEDEKLNRMAGIIMEKIDSSYMLADAYSEEHPLSIRVKALVAKKLCEAVIAVHSNPGNVCIGDFNSKNITVNRVTGDIRIIDCDSLHVNVHINAVPETLPCTELDPTLFMPEIIRLFQQNKGANLENLSRRFQTFTRYTDYYCLAYHIHMLLLACTPFGRAVDKSLISKSVPVPSSKEMSAKGQYAYTNLPDNTHLPEKFPDFDVITPELQRLFIRAFVDGAADPTKRPTPNEFKRAIEKYLDGLLYCECDGWDHYLHEDYFNKKGRCEWCRIEKVIRPRRIVDPIDIVLMNNDELLQFIKLMSEPNRKSYAMFEYGNRCIGEAYVIKSGYIKMKPDMRTAKKYFEEALKITQNEQIRQKIKNGLNKVMSFR